LLSAAAAFGATFNVNSTADLQDGNPGDGVCQTATAGQCTLRAAITEANALAGDDVISLPAGTYQIALVGFGEDANAGGDFDIRSNIAVNGAGSGTTIIQAAGAFNSSIERVMQFVTGTSSVTGVTMRFGGTPGGGSAGGILADGLFATNNALPLPSITFNDVTVRDNTSSGPGGGVRLQNNATATFKNSLITGNFAGSSGGGMDASGSQLTLTNTIVSSNTVSSNTGNAAGGGVSMSTGGAFINGSTISNNTASTTAANANALGGGIYGNASVSVNGSSISGNTANATGGGQSLGGGIYEDVGIVSISHSLVSANTASRAGGAYSVGMIIDRSAILNNIGTVFGGGFVNALSTASITNSTFYGNSSNGAGSAIVNISPAVNPAVTNLKYVTVTGNTSTGSSAPAILNASSGGAATINMQASIVSNNTDVGGERDLAGVTSQGYNHIQAAPGGFTTATGDVVGTDPNLAAASGTGADTVLLPATGSPVIDAIPNGTAGCGNAPTNVDQRGVTRPTDSNGDTIAACEKGAAEIAAPTAARVSVSGRVTINGNGISGATVTIMDAAGNRKSLRTNLFGYYRFDDILSGTAYVIGASDKRVVFDSRLITVTDQIADLNFSR